MKMNLEDLKEYINDMSKGELVEDIMKLAKDNKVIREYYLDKYYEGYSDYYLNDAKEKIRFEFFPNNGIGRFNFNIIKEVIEDYRRLSSSPRCTADLMIYTVENGIDFVVTYGDITDQFYKNMEKLFDDSLYYISKRDLEEKFLSRASKIVVETDSLGRGFGERINKIYMKYMAEHM